MGFVLLMEIFLDLSDQAGNKSWWFQDVYSIFSSWSSMLNLVADLFNKVLYHLFWLSIVPAPYHRWSLVGSLAKLLGAPLFQEFKCAEIITMSKSILWGR
jgi:hypothetical protein